MAKSIHIKPIRKINCSNCQNTISIYHPNSHYLGCKKCKSLIKLEEDELTFSKAIYKLDEIEDSLSNISLSLGMIGKFAERRYIIIARTRYYAQFQEYYEKNAEEGLRSGYESNNQTYDVWKLKDTEAESYFWLIQDTKNFYFSEIFHSPNPIIPNESKPLLANFIDPNQTYRITEYGNINRIFFEGENETHPAQNLKYWRCNVNDVIYAAELNLDYYANSENTLHYYQIKHIPKNITILEAFAENYSIQKKLENAKILKFARTIAGLFGLVLAILFFYSLFEKKIIYEQNFDFEAFNDTTFQNSQEWSLSSGLYLIETEIQSLSPTYDNQEVYVVVEIYDEEDLLVNEVVGDFWSAKGVEDGEAWAESNMYAYKYVHLPEKGKYSAEISLEKNPNFISGNFTIRVRQGGVIWYIMLIPFVFIAIIFTILQLIIYQRKLE